MNSPIQGAAADIIKIAMIRVNQRLKDQKMKSRLVLQVHDELLIEAYEPELDEVQNILKEEMDNKYGATICMTDEVGKKLQKKGTECFDEIVAHFGNEILDEKGELDRAKLSDIVFADRVELSVLNGIVHPRVKEEIQKKITREERKNTNLMLIEGALLIEDHYEEICDELWYVYVEDSIRRKRLKYARGYEDSKVNQIFEAQLPKDLFMRHCDRVIDNSGQFEETKIQLNKIVEDL